MQQQRIEAQVLDIVETVVDGKRVEDDRVELKRDWPIDFRGTARRIAGHANAAGGEPILWIIGLDDKAHQVREPTEVDPADWWSQVSACFSEAVVPDLTFFRRVVTPDGTAVFALSMDTTHTPYMVTTDGRGGVEREVPWRTSTAVRSARRSEILRSVIREAEVPQLEPIAGWMRAVRLPATPGDPRFGESADPISVEVEYHLSAYVEAREPVRLPQYRWALDMVLGEHRWRLPNPAIAGPQRWIPGPSSPSGFGGGRYDPIGSIAYVLNSGLHVNGSDTITLSGRMRIDDPHSELDKSFRKARRLVVSARFPIALSTREAAFDAVLRRAKLIPMDSWRPSDDDRHVDERLGEFTFGGDRPSTYSGRFEKVQKVPTT